MHDGSVIRIIPAVFVGEFLFRLGKPPYFYSCRRIPEFLAGNRLAVAFSTNYYAFALHSHHSFEKTGYSYTIAACKMLQQIMAL